MQSTYFEPAAKSGWRCHAERRTLLQANSKVDRLDSLVFELQREALDKSVGIADLLRKALLVARKLNVSDIEQWITNELNGYPQGSPSVEYRKLRGELRARYLHTGNWLPLHVQDPKVAELLSVRATGQSAAELEDLVRHDRTASAVFYMRHPPDLEAKLLRGNDEANEAGVQIGISQIRGLLDRIRTIVLEWALALEQKGILGQGMTFSTDEQKVAMTVNIENMIGTMNDSQLQSKTNFSTQKFHKGVGIEEIKNLLDDLRKLSESENLSDTVRAQVTADVVSIDAQTKAPSPKWRVIEESLVSIRAVLEGVAGNAAFFGLQVAISKLFS